MNKKGAHYEGIKDIDFDRMSADSILLGMSFIFSLQVFMPGRGGAGVAGRGGCKAWTNLFRELP